MATTSIEWTRSDDGTPGVVWNPTTGCDQVSAGCDNCYALTMAKRLKSMGQAKYQNDGDPRTSGPGFGLTVHEDALTIPLRWHKPRRVFVNSMSDLFHARVPREFVARVWAVMAATPQHTYQLLTKRPQRAARMLTDRCACGAGHVDGVHFRSEMEWAATSHSPAYVPGLPSELYHQMTWPLPNVWLGVSVEDQERADLRIPALLDTPAAVRWLSCEPLIGPVDLSRYLWLVGASTAGPWTDGLGRRRRTDGRGRRLSSGVGGMTISNTPAADLHWTVLGGESGPRARPMRESWATSLVDQCRAADVPVFMKQMGSRWGKHHHDIDRFPEHLRIRDYPAVQVAGGRL